MLALRVDTIPISLFSRVRECHEIMNMRVVDKGQRFVFHIACAQRGMLRLRCTYLQRRISSNCTGSRTPFERRSSVVLLLPERLALYISRQPLEHLGRSTTELLASKRPVAAQPYCQVMRIGFACLFNYNSSVRQLLDPLHTKFDGTHGNRHVKSHNIWVSDRKLPSLDTGEAKAFETIAV